MSDLIAETPVITAAEVRKMQEHVSKSVSRLEKVPVSHFAQPLLADAEIYLEQAGLKLGAAAEYIERWCPDV